MNSRRIYLLLFVLFFPFTAGLAQNKTTKNNLILNYNEWLKSAQLEKMLQASTLETSVDSSVNTLYLEPAPGINDLQELATNWRYIKEGLLNKGIRIEALLWYKFAGYRSLPPRQLKVKIITADTAFFQVEISFDTAIRMEEHINDVRGGEVTLNYNFNEAGNMLNNSYPLKKALPDLCKYYPSLENYFKKSKHLPGAPVAVKATYCNKDLIILDITNVFGEATGKKYHEKIGLMVMLSSSAITYQCTVLCAGGISQASEFVDAANETDLKDNLRLYNNVLDRVFKSVFYESIH